MKAFSSPFRATMTLRIFGFFKIPLLLFVNPRVLELNSKRAVVKIPLSRRTKNHLGSMYFGALAIGADCVAGLLSLYLVEEEGGKVHFSFKDFRADFLTRPEENVHFICEDGEKILPEIRRTLTSGERVSFPVNAYAIIPSKPSEPVAKFVLTVSLKAQKK